MIKCTTQIGAALSMTRGDSATFHFHREDADGKVITTEATKIFFTVKSNAENEAFVIQKTIEDFVFDENSEYHFTINPDDTNDLAYGDYVYDLEVIREDGSKQTISKGTFTLTWESTWASNEGEA